MAADEARRRVLHRREVERTVAEGPERRKVRRQDVRLVDEVAVLLALRVVACVEVRPREGRAHDANVVREARVHRADEVLRRNGDVEVDVGAEPARMDARIGSAAAEDAHGRAVDVRKGLLQTLLDGDAVLLQLVAGVARAVVREDDAVALHFVLNVKKSGR